VQQATPSNWGSASFERDPTDRCDSYSKIAMDSSTRSSNWREQTCESRDAALGHINEVTGLKVPVFAEGVRIQHFLRVNQVSFGYVQ